MKRKGILPTIIFGFAISTFLVIGVIIIGCTDKGISKQPKDDMQIFKLQEDFYLRRVSIEGTTIFIRCTEDGQFISNPVAVKYQSGKSSHTTNGLIIEE